MTAKQNISKREERAAALEMKITITLITVVIIFIFCQLPTAATLIYKIFHVAKFSSNEEAVLRALGNIFNFLVSLNSACNFILYCALSEKYRRTFMLTFFPCCYRRPSRFVHSKAIFSQQIIGGRNDVAKFNSRPSHSAASTRANPAVIPLRTWAASQTSKLQCTPTTPVPTRRKENCYIIALPIISGIIIQQYTLYSRYLNNVYFRMFQKMGPRLTFSLQIVIANQLLFSSTITIHHLLHRLNATVIAS